MARVRAECAIENDGSLVIGEFDDERGVQFWSWRRESNCHMDKQTHKHTNSTVDYNSDEHRD